MATLTITSATGTDTTSKVLTYSGADAQNIFDLWSKYIWYGVRPGGQQPPAPTHQDFTNWCGQHLADMFQSWNTQDKTVITPPAPIGIT